MKKLTKEEAQAYVLRRSSCSPVRTAIEHLAVGEILLVERKDWAQQKNGPRAMCNQIKKRSGMEYKVSVVASGEGWLVERTK
jgi:hypothetical protein